MAEEIIKIVLSTVIPSLITGLCVYVKGVKKDSNALKEGMLSLLRAELIRQHDKWSSQGYCPIYAKDALEKAYKAYHQLGGNGTMTRIYENTMALDTEPEQNNESA